MSCHANIRCINMTTLIPVEKLLKINIIKGALAITLLIGFEVQFSELNVNNLLYLLTFHC